MQNYQPPPIPNPTASCGLATSSLVCGIFGVVFGPISGIPAIITGHMALGRIKKSGGILQGHGKAVAGLVLGYIFSALFFVLAVLAGAGFAASNSAITTARRLTAMATAVAIESAVNNYLTEYGTLPHAGTSDATIVTSTDTDLLHVLLGMEGAMNKRSIKFLSVREGRENKNGLIYASDGRSVIGEVVTMFAWIWILTRSWMRVARPWLIGGLLSGVMVLTASLEPRMTSRLGNAIIQQKKAPFLSPDTPWVQSIMTVPQ